MCLTQACAATATPSAARERRAPIHPHGDQTQGPSMCERATLAESHRQWEHPFPGTADQVRHVRAALRGFLGDCPVTTMSSSCSASCPPTPSPTVTAGRQAARSPFVPSTSLTATCAVKSKTRAAAGTATCPGRPGTRTAYTCWSSWPPTTESSGSGASTSSGSASTTGPDDRSPPRLSSAHPQRQP